MEELKKTEETSERVFTEKEVMDIVNNINNECTKKLMQSNNVLTRLTFLFKIIENKDVFQGTEFFDECVKEIIEIMTLTEEKNEKSKA
jgi:hypothetical protein